VYAFVARMTVFAVMVPRGVCSVCAVGVEVSEVTGVCVCRLRWLDLMRCSSV
jgi:hypothetical protein